MFTVGQLKEFLAEFDVPDDAVIAVLGEVVTGCELRKGRIRNGHMSTNFHIAEKGKERAIMFTRVTELSTGEIVNTTI